MRRSHVVLAAACLAVATVVSAAGKIVPIPLPLQSFSFATDVNERGGVVGIHSNESVTRAFIRVRKDVTLFSYPGASFTSATGLNDAGDVVGIYAAGNGVRGFFRSRKGRLSTIDIPNAVDTSPEDVNKRHQVVGHFTELLPNTDPWTRGFLLDASGVHLLENPFGGFFTLPQGINDRGTIVGWFGGPEGDDPRRGFIFEDGTWTAVDYPGADQTYVTGVASDGTVVGYAVFFFGDPPEIGFVYRDGTFEHLPPGFQPYGVNRAGTVVGVASAPLARAATTCSPLRARGKCRLR